MSALVVAQPLPDHEYDMSDAEGLVSRPRHPDDSESRICLDDIAAAESRAATERV
jgi:hypothetical protein